MEKIIPVSGWDFGEESAVLAKFSSDGRLHENDARRLIKRAGNGFVELARKVQLGPGEEAVHQIALGATEAYGPNRNGDGFKEATLRKYHPTFVKYAKVYRNHNNKNPAKSYGVIKLSWYNDAMRRVELLLCLNATKEAARRNGGLVADKELEKLARGEDLAGSMSCTVPFDVCSSCGNRARSRAEYCDEDSCVGPHGEKRGGCKRYLAKVASDGHLLHVDNPNPRFFDYSSVLVPADRIAYGNLATYLSKAAADGGGCPSGAEAAELFRASGNYCCPLDEEEDQEIFQAPEKSSLWHTKAAQLKEAYCQYLMPWHSALAEVDQGGGHADFRLDDSWVKESVGRIKHAAELEEFSLRLAERGMIAPLSLFIYASALGKVTPQEAVKSAELVRPYGEVALFHVAGWSDEEWAERLASNAWAKPLVKPASWPGILPASYLEMADRKYGDWRLLDGQWAKRRWLLSSGSGKRAFAKTASHPVEWASRRIAEDYLLYKTAALVYRANHAGEKNLLLIGRYLILENCC